MIGNVLTISLASWMELPGLDFRSWEETVGCIEDSQNVNSEYLNNNNNNNNKEGRARAASVAQYYSDYVRLRGLQRYFHSGTKVLNIEPIEGACCQVGFIFLFISFSYKEVLLVQMFLITFLKLFSVV